MVNLAHTPNLESRTFAVFLGEERRFLGYFPISGGTDPRYSAGLRAAQQAGYSKEDFDNCNMPILRIEEVLMPHIKALEAEIRRIEAWRDEIRGMERVRIQKLVHAFEDRWSVSTMAMDNTRSGINIGSLAWDHPNGTADVVGALWDPEEDCFVDELEACRGRKVAVTPPFPIEEWKTLLERISQGQWKLAFGQGIL